jgi:hypothetical protein
MTFSQRERDASMSTTDETGYCFLLSMPQADWGEGSLSYITDET